MFESLDQIVWLVLAQADAASGAADAAKETEIQSVWDFVVKGGLMMIPIGICSLVALAVVTERAASLRRARNIPPNFLSDLRKVIKENPNDTKRAVRYCEKNESPVARVFAAGLKRIHNHSIESVERHITEAGQREVLKLRKFMRMLSVIAAVSPLLGLLGTIFGMIRAFQTVAMSAEALGKTELLAEGIYEAMITTAAGLIVAIPVLIAYHWLSGKVQNLVMEIDTMTVDFIEEWTGGKFEGAPVEEHSAEAAREEAQEAQSLGAMDVGVAAG